MMQFNGKTLMGRMQRIRADLSGSADGEQLFEDVRELSFDDREEGWLETAVARLRELRLAKQNAEGPHFGSVAPQNRGRASPANCQVIVGRGQLAALMTNLKIKRRGQYEALSLQSL